MLLTKEEREKFASYLEQNAQSNKAILQQLEKSDVPPAAKAVMMQSYKQEIAACVVIINLLRRIDG